MSDTEALNLIEHYKWNITFNGDWITIQGANNIFNLEFNSRNLRGAIKSALDMQRKWGAE